MMPKNILLLLVQIIAQIIRENNIIYFRRLNTIAEFF